MKTHSGYNIPPMAIGSMNWTSNIYGPGNIENSERTMTKALQKGLVHIDTADCYLGSSNNPNSEIFIGEILKKIFKKGAVARQDVFLATKCGIKLDPTSPWEREIDISPSYIKTCCEKSLSQLETNYIDLFYLHRIKKKESSLNDSMKALLELQISGKIRHIGLCEVNKSLLKDSDECLRNLSKNSIGLSAIQTEYNLLSRSPEKNGVFQYCRDQEIKFFAYSPLSRGLVSSKTITINEPEDCRQGLDRFLNDNLQRNQKLLGRLLSMANRKGCSLPALALAWIISQGRSMNIKIYPILGTSNPKHLDENLSALNISLNHSDLTEINQLVPLELVQGLRYPKKDMDEFGLDQ